MEDENKVIVTLSFIGGVIVGANWNRIKRFSRAIVNKTTKVVSKGCKGTYRFLSVQKEHIQDLLAEAKVKKKENYGVRK